MLILMCEETSELLKKIIGNEDIEYCIRVAKKYKMTLSEDKKTIINIIKNVSST